MKIIPVAYAVLRENGELTEHRENGSFGIFVNRDAADAQCKPELKQRVVKCSLVIDNENELEEGVVE